jgi:OOP family OmpA-OmpF porin
MPKKILIRILFYLCPICCIGQVKLRKDPSLTVQAVFFDFNNKPTSYAMGLGFTQGLSTRFDIVVNMMGGYVKYPYRHQPQPTTNSLLLQTDALLRWKLFTDRRILVPFVTLGTSISHYNGAIGLFVPTGAGLQLRLSKGIFIFAEGQYRWPLTAKVSQHGLYSFGICGSLVFRKKQLSKAAPTPPKGSLVIDSDLDGVCDSLDKCPSTPGLASYHGCPSTDSDGDGIADDKDKCPSQAGILANEGCPVADSDGDGINDFEDKCPFVAGGYATQGCPVVTNNLQDTINRLAGAVFFITGEALLTKEAKQALNDLAQLLSANALVLITIEGHTDNSGNTAANQFLSLARAEAVKAYLVTKGIKDSRLSANGFGNTRPVASNRTKEGRAANRRVEIKIRANE